MNNKTCGECCGFSESENRCLLLGGRGEAYADNEACRRFSEKKPKVITNGDRIRQGDNRRLAEFNDTCSCDMCIYEDMEFNKGVCNKPSDKTCVDGIEAWLNAPAKEGEDE